MNIPENKYDIKKDEEKFANLILSKLKDLDTVEISYNQAPSKVICLNVAKEFVNRGYYASITYFKDNRAPFQQIKISKKPLEEYSANMIYSILIN